MREIGNCMLFLNNNVKFVSRNTTRGDVVKHYEKEKQILKKELDSVIGNTCLTTELWESDTSDGYMAITAHYVGEKWELQNRLLIFRHVPPPHNGVVLAKRMFEFLKEWGIENRIFTITLDNASYNDRMIRSLKNYFSFDGSSICANEFLHVRCGAHVLNLIVQSGLNAIQDPIYKIRETIKYLKYSEVRKRRFATYVRQLSLPTNKKLRQDLATRWNSTFLMLEREIVFKEALLRLKEHDEGYVDCPTIDEWKRIEKIAAFLKPFYDLTVLFSTRRYPTKYGNNVGKSELETYLGEKLVDRKLNPHLDILGYWKDAVVRYPQLSLVAKDILSIPIKNVTFEYSFSHGGRILGTYQTSLLPENLEAIVCYRDWLRAKRAALDDEIRRVALDEDEKALGVDINFTSEHDGSSNVG